MSIRVNNRSSTRSRNGKFIPSEKFDEKFETLRLDAQEILFDADAVQQSSLRRNAAVRSGWFWLPRNGLDQLVKLAIQRGFWREREGLIAKKWERRTKVIARLDDFGPNPIETGRFLINVTPEDADTVYVSEGGRQIRRPLRGSTDAFTRLRPLRRGSSPLTVRAWRRRAKPVNGARRSA
jgi:hypothetical protein